jgi:hypothetical protein
MVSLDNFEGLLQYESEYIDYIAKKHCLISGEKIATPYLMSSAMCVQSFTAIPLSEKLKIELEFLGVLEFERKYKIELWEQIYYHLVSFFALKGVLKLN